ncbi:hypothetical protein N5C66_00760 [Rhizobium pusense]|uniref:hypothetical protein n=1 Tax=Agrobacterium pusense TaxID=648995 RepID=UPI002447922A|nr:hypothetical protein [Agrobacterium pusense]MDH1093840.1 hypothetical protein [Agrobacterium pusense]MDH1110264.1 hypothetical protein [Agrobacterium pusense]MDH2193706.1 hypothetical protein [Agrobacterium pusense]
MSVPAQHLFLLEKGWTHDDLNAMDEAEFAWWYAEQIELEEAKAAAIKAASTKT